MVKWDSVIHLLNGRLCSEGYVFLSTSLPEQIQEAASWGPEMGLPLDAQVRFRALTGVVKDLVEHDIGLLGEWKAGEVIELNLQADHIHLVISLSPKISVAELMGTLKGKLAIKLFKSDPQLKKKPCWGNHFWSRGYDEDPIRRYVNYQEGKDRKEENHSANFDLFDSPT